MRWLWVVVLGAAVAACTAADPAGGPGLGAEPPGSEGDTGASTDSPDSPAKPTSGIPLPTNVTAEAGDAAVLLRWEIQPGVTVDSFRVHYRALLPGPPWDGSGALNGDSPLEVAGSTSMTVAGLDNGRIYYFCVAAVSGGVEGPRAAPVKATPDVAKGSLVLVPAGVFTMGATPGINQPNEEPAHEVYLDALWMDKYTTTNAQYRVCVDAGACDPPVKLSGFFGSDDDYFHDPDFDDYPVVFLENAAAAGYCAWRGMRLPTEAEWEKGARGTDGRIHPWGDAEPSCELGNFQQDNLHLCVGGPTPVGKYAANVSPYGAVEMAGNVWSWTQDWYHPEYYGQSPCKNPTGPAEPWIPAEGAPPLEEKVLRGGSWYYGTEALTVTYRNHWPVDLGSGEGELGGYYGFGVRCVRDAIGVPCDPSSADCMAPCGDEPAPPDPPDSDSGNPPAPDSGGQATDAGEADAGGQADAEAPDVADAVAPDATEPDAQSDTNPDPPPCVIPQDYQADPSPCFNVSGTVCPSGWPKGCGDDCEGKTVGKCVLGATTEPGNCGAEAMTLTLGWQDANFAFVAFVKNQPHEICDNGQPGGHLRVAVKVDAPLLEGSYFYADQFMLLRIDGLVVGWNTKSSLKFEKDAASGGFFTKSAQTVVFEGCNLSSYPGKKATVEVLVRDKQKGWGWSSQAIELKDEVEGPFLDPEKKNGC